MFSLTHFSLCRLSSGSLSLGRLSLATAMAGLMASQAAMAQSELVWAPGSPQTPDLGHIVGQAPKGPSAPTPRSADGHPDLGGFWKTLPEPGKPVGNLGRDEPNYQLPFTPAGREALEFLHTKTIDPEALCILGGIPRHNGSALPFEVLQTRNRVAFLYLYTTHRVIPLDGRAHDADPDPAYFGNPIGSWDGDTLVIDTIGLKDSRDGKVWGDENANPVSDQTHVIERWTRPDFDHLHLEMTVIDPKYYTRPIHYARTWVHAQNRTEGLREYACSENNIDAAHLGPGPGPIKPDGTRGYAVPALPKDPPGPDAYDLSDRKVGTRQP